MSFRHITIALVLFVSLYSCKKHESKPLSGSKNITSFILRASDNPDLPNDVTGVIQSDSIVLTLPPAKSLSNRIPTISITGVSITPADKAPQDFSKYVNYTVTAEDGTQRNYKVIARNEIAPKEITGFTFTIADNPGIYGDASGIIGTDTIVVEMPVSTDVTALKATVTINGVSVSPASATTLDYSLPVSYTVTGVDNTTKKYVVVVKQKAVTFITSANSSLYALDAETGKIYWQKFLGGSLTGATYSNGTVYSCNSSTVFALQAANGNLKWQHNNLDGIGAQPFANENSVFITFLTYQFVLSLHGFVAALDAQTGNLQWQTLISNADNDLFVSSPVYNNGKVYLNDFYSGTNCFDAVTGALVWQHGENLQTCTPLVYNGNVYTGGEGSVSDFDAGSGAVNWQLSSAGNTKSTPAVTSDAVYIGGYQRVNTVPTGAKLMAFNKSDGSLLWAIDPILNHEGAFMSVTPYGDNVFTVAGARLLSYKKSDGSLNWFYDLGVNTNPIIANGILYVSAGSTFMAFDPNTGQGKWVLQNGETFTANPCIADVSGNVYQCGLQ